MPGTTPSDDENTTLRIIMQWRPAFCQKTILTMLSSARIHAGKVRARLLARVHGLRVLIYVIDSR